MDGKNINTNYFYGLLEHFPLLSPNDIVTTYTDELTSDNACVDLQNCCYSVYLASFFGMLHCKCISCFLIILFVYVDKRRSSRLYGWCISI